jgi:hypothetical protein
MGFEMNLYIVQEYLGVLLMLAVSTAIILVFAVAFVIFQEGIRRAMLWGKTDSRSTFRSPEVPSALIAKKRVRFQLTR